MFLKRDEFVTRFHSDGLESVSDTIVLGDCLDILTHFPDDCVDLIHTSPPYNIDKPYKGERKDSDSLAEYVSFLEAAIIECKRIVKPYGSIFWQTGYTQQKNIARAGILPIDVLSYAYFCEGDVPFLLWDRIIWRYFGGMAFKRKFTNRHETIMWYVKPDRNGQASPHFDVDSVREKSLEYDKRNNFWGKNPGNVWEVDRVAYGATEQSSHIAVFPEEVSEKIIRAGTPEGALVLDPFSGSGTTSKVARSLGRHWIGIEISEEYAKESVIRLGYQQPSEMLSLISNVIKFEVFARRQSCSLEEVCASLKVWARSIDAENLHKEFEDITDVALNDTTKSKLSKRKVWIEIDDRINETSLPVVTADRYLLRDYKNRRNLNGVTRYSTALQILKYATQKIEGSSDEQIRQLVVQIVRNEPSSYSLQEDSILLSGTEKRIRVNSDESRKPEGYKVQLGFSSLADSSEIYLH